MRNALKLRQDLNDAAPRGAGSCGGCHSSCGRRGVPTEAWLTGEAGDPVLEPWAPPGSLPGQRDRVSAAAYDRRGVSNR